MKLRNTLYKTITVILIFINSGCAVQRNQETMGAYVDDSVITTTIKSKFFEDKTIDGSAITVQTLKGVVILSGFVTNAEQIRKAEVIASKVKGVSEVRNKLTVH
jgi:osmotically-inducible protein OsmY